MCNEQKPATTEPSTKIETGFNKAFIDIVLIFLARIANKTTVLNIEAILIAKAKAGTSIMAQKKAIATLIKTPNNKTQNVVLASSKAKKL